MMTDPRDIPTLLTDSKPPLDDEQAARIDRIVADAQRDDTPAAAHDRAGRRRFGSWPLLRVAAPAVCAVAVAIAVVAAPWGDQAGSDGVRAGGANSAALSKRAPVLEQSSSAGVQLADEATVDPVGPSEPVTGPALPPPGGDDGTLGEADRKQNRHASLEIAADDVGRAATEANRIAAQVGGYAATSNVTDSGDRRARADLHLVVPADKLDEATGKLAGLGDVLSRSQSATDITGAFNDAQDTVDRLRAERRGLMRELARAGSGLDRSHLRAELEANRMRLQEAERQLAARQSAASAASIELSIVKPGERAAQPGVAENDPMGVSDAAGKGLRWLENVAAVVVLIVIVAGIPALVAAGGYVAVRRIRRR